MPLAGDTTMATPVVEDEVEEQQKIEDIMDLPAGGSMLVVRRGPNAGSRISLEKGETTIGREPSSDVFLDDITVSRKHAVIERHNGTVILRDAGSLNGTYVNSNMIDSQEVVPGDEIQIGRYVFVFLSAEAS